MFRMIKIEKKGNKDSPLTDYILLFLCVLTAYIANRVFNASGSPILIKGLMEFGIVTVFLIWYIDRIRKKHVLSLEQSIIIIGIILRIGYMLYTICGDRAHDFGALTKDSPGQAGYLLNIIEGGHLPPDNNGQFYQQPFYYLCAGLVSKLVNVALRSNEAYYLVDAARTVSCFASCAILLLIKPILNECHVRKEGVPIALAMVSFTPAFFLAGGSVTCDGLGTLFMMLEIYFTIKWYRKTTWDNTIFLAISYGLGVMTKISCGIFAIFTLCVFVYKLYKNHVKKDHASLRNIFSKLVVFGCISLPLGLWYCIRNAMLFAQPFTYVLKISEQNELYTGSVPFFMRTFYIDWENLIRSPYTDVLNDYNAPVYYLKSSLFGEFTFEVPHLIPRALLAVSVVMAIITLAIVIRQFIVQNTSRVSFLITALFCGYYLSMLWFYMKNPAGCSMDYRYMMILSVFAAVLMGDYYEQGRKPYRYIMIGAMSTYSILSTIMYIW